LMPLDAPLTGALKESSHWRVVYDDGMALVFRPNSRTGDEVSAALTSGGEAVTARLRKPTRVIERSR